MALGTLKPAQARTHHDQRERVAIIGTGIAGMCAAHLLQARYDLTIFEANDYLGGHTHTVDVVQDGVRHAVDTGFIVYNEKTYPGFIALLEKFGVATQPTNMSFSVQDQASGTEYASADLNAVFAQRRNLLRPRFLRMVTEIVRFNSEARRFLDSGDDSTTLTELLHALRFSETFAQWYLTPMLAAIWSAEPSKVGEFPARHFLRFFENHGLLSINGRPQWRVITGGSREYTKKLCAPFADRVLLNSPVQRVVRGENGVRVITRDGIAHDFDRVVMASHSDESLALIEDTTPLERAVLGAIPYQVNDVVLHTDRSLLPRRRRAWASWNYHVPSESRALPSVTYHMNALQGIESRKPFLVTLNDTARIAPGEILGRWPYSHPSYSRDGIAAQARHAELNAASRLHFCGAYWGYGFHEDGVQSAIRLAQHLGVEATV